MAVTTSGERVLIVEDDPSTRLGLTELVRTWGFTSESAANGEEALERVTEFRPSIVISDMVMPGMGGRALATELANRKHNVPIVLMSGYTRDSLAGNSELGSGGAFIEKPFTPDKLLKKINDVLEAARAPAQS